MGDSNEKTAETAENQNLEDKINLAADNNSANEKSDATLFSFPPPEVPGTSTYVAPPETSSEYNYPYLSEYYKFSSHPPAPENVSAYPESLASYHSHYYQYPPPAYSSYSASYGDTTSTYRSYDNSRSARSKSRIPQDSASSFSKHSRERNRSSESRYSNRDSDRKSYRSSSTRKHSSTPSSYRHRERSRSPRRSYTRSPPRYRDSRNDRDSRKSKKPETERDRIIAKWRKNYCETSADISRKLEELANDDDKGYWVRSSPADVYYKRVSETVVESTSRLDSLCTLFEDLLIKRSARAKEKQDPYVPPPRKRKFRSGCRHKGKLH